MFIEYKCGNGMPWQADDHHTPEWESRCKDTKPNNPESWCSYCDSGHRYRCEEGYLDFVQVRARGRDYELFSRLCDGVRGNGSREALGLPDDASEVVQEASEAYGVDGHSHSYISLDEFKKALFDECGYEATDRSDAFYDRSLPYDKHPPDFTTIVNYCEKLKQDKSIDKHILGEDTSSEVQIRLVFWFDN